MGRLQIKPFLYGEGRVTGEDMAVCLVWCAGVLNQFWEKVCLGAGGSSEQLFRLGGIEDVGMPGCLDDGKARGCAVFSVFAEP